MNAKVLMVRGEEWEPKLRQIPYWEVSDLWPTVKPMLQKAIDTQDYWTAEGVYQCLINPSLPMTNQMQLWYAGKFALVTQIQIGGTGIRKCLLFLCGGEDLENIKSSKTTIIEWAKKYYGCSKLTIVGRRGWIKALGFQEKETIMECEI